MDINFCKRIVNLLAYFKLATHSLFCRFLALRPTYVHLFGNLDRDLQINVDSEPLQSPSHDQVSPLSHAGSEPATLGSEGKRPYHSDRAARNGSGSNKVCVGF